MPMTTTFLHGDYGEYDEYDDDDGEEEDYSGGIGLDDTDRFVRNRNRNRQSNDRMDEDSDLDEPVTSSRTTDYNAFDSDSDEDMAPIASRIVESSDEDE